ncbi:GH3 auxin-responsive promoter family protein [bacterium]|nr:GH3 auxin-responsive promoter family protein [bacterium]
MPILNSILSLVNNRRLTQVDHFKSNGDEVQQQQLFELLKTAKDTEWGNKYDFSSVSSIVDFTQRIPVQRYEDIAGSIEQARQGKANLMWPGEIKWFAKSSGTTSSKSKYIPVSKEALEDCHYRGGKDVLAIYNQLYPENEMLTGKGLTLGGSQQLNPISKDSMSGDLSAILIGNMPFWTNFIKTPNQSIALMDEWEEKLVKITDATINENVTSITGVPSWLLVLLKHILKISGTNNLLDIWPNLELFIHGGINFSPYREQYKKIIPSDNMRYMETYNASEGFFAIQDDPSTDAMLLMLDYGIFYEFIPMNEVDKPFPKTLQLHEVELDTNYALVITTNGGLWRYLIGDTIQFKSKNPYRIVISGRTKHFINAFGEELIIDNATKALHDACAKTNALIKEYTAAPKYMSTDSKGCHEWLIEFERPPESLAYFEEVLDHKLQSLNSDYEAKRYKDITLTTPVVIVGKTGLFFEWLKEKNKLGGQNKVPRLSNNRDYIDELIKVNQRISN